jgi:hypothetical protein
VLAGCGPKRGTVDGKITIDGRPVNSGRVFFRSADEKSVVFAYIDRDGSYHAMDVPMGPMNVWVTPPTKMEREKAQRIAAGRAKKGTAPEAPEAPVVSFVPIPKKYQDPTTSKLTTTVQGRTNSYNIEMLSR